MEKNLTNNVAPVLGICMFLGLPDPDLLVRDMDPDPDPFLFSKGVARTEIMLAK